MLALRCRWGIAASQHNPDELWVEKRYELAHRFFLTAAIPHHRLGLSSPLRRWHSEHISRRNEEATAEGLTVAQEKCDNPWPRVGHCDIALEDARRWEWWLHCSTATWRRTSVAAIDQGSGQNGIATVITIAFAQTNSETYTKSDRYRTKSKKASHKAAHDNQHYLQRAAFRCSHRNWSTVGRSTIKHSTASDSVAVERDEDCWELRLLNTSIRYENPSRMTTCCGPQIKTNDTIFTRWSIHFRRMRDEWIGWRYFSGWRPVLSLPPQCLMEV